VSPVKVPEFDELGHAARCRRGCRVVGAGASLSPGWSDDAGQQRIMRARQRRWVTPGLHEVVKASLVGSILGNALLVTGGAILAGGARNERQRFDSLAVCAQSFMLVENDGLIWPHRDVLNWPRLRPIVA
jgi:hypothetical protein